MKKSILTVIAILACGLFASAQEAIRENPNDDALDRRQQEPPRPTERRLESAARNSAKKDRQTKKQKAVTPVNNEKSVMDKPKDKAKSKHLNGQVNPPQ